MTMNAPPGTFAQSLDFTGKVIIITGASSGIGAAAAKLFAAHGAYITAVGRNEVRLNEVANVCATFKGNRPLCVLRDLTSEGGCEEVVERTMETYKKIDVLINCAGKAAMTSLFDATIDVFDDICALNLRVTYKLTQLCLPDLKKTKGNIVNVFAFPLPMRPGLLPFMMVRDALERFTTSGACELVSEGVRMNAVRPGVTRTNFLANFNVSDECMAVVYNEIANSMPNSVINEPEEVARMILFVASDTCPNLNGANIVIDGASSSC